MAKVLFISLYDRNAYGQRLMSANLKRHGHSCHIVFLKRYGSTPELPGPSGASEHAWIGIDKRGREFTYASGSPITAAELALLREVIERVGPDLIGLTVNTPLRGENARVTSFLRGFSTAPIVWGGYDPTVNTAACVELADYACAGEGDGTIIELAEAIDRGEPLERVRNLAYQRNGQLVFNERAPLAADLDALPWRDNEPENKYFIEDGGMVENYPGLNDRPGSYQTMTSRGCPYRCTYCCEASLKDLYAGERFLRRRSITNSVAELAEVKARFQVNEILFEDEIFGMDFKWLSEFEPLYQVQVDLPFQAYVYPTRNVDRLLPLLQLAGLKCCCVALESGSVRINRTVFQRVYDRELFLKTVRLCRRLGIDFYTDVITYNPYEEESDLKETLGVLLDMRGQYHICVNKLSVFPGSPLAKQMERDGLKLGDRSRDRLFQYYCRLFWVSSFSPHARWVVRRVEKVRIFRRHPEWLSLGLLEWLLCGPIGKTINILLPPPSDIRKAKGPRVGWRKRLRRLVEPPAPLIMNPAEPKSLRTGRYNLYIGGAGRFIPGFVNLDLSAVAGVDVAADAEQLPFRAGVFQAVECDGVLQRIRRPALLLKEIERVLRPGGYAHLVAPFCHPLTEHRESFHHFTLDGLKAMTGNMDVVAEGWRTGPSATLLIFFIEYVKLLLPWRWWRAVTHGVLGWLLFPLRYLDLLLFRSPYLNRLGNHCYLWLRKPYDTRAAEAASPRA